MSVSTPLRSDLPGPDGRPAARDGITARKVMVSGKIPAGEYWAARAGDSPFVPGEILHPGTVVPRPLPVWTFPALPEERPIPFFYSVIHRDDNILVVDKPHFLPSTANGRLQRETLQTRIRRDFGEAATVLHRLDRLTAGVVLCSLNPLTRGRYQQLFANRMVTKIYEAHVDGRVVEGEMRFPLLKVTGSRQVIVDDRGAETVTFIRKEGRHVELEPVTGFTHQLRAVMNHLGAPIVGDDTYPVDRGLSLYDFRTPLHLLARRITFEDPVTGGHREFSSLRSLPDRIK